MQTLRLPSTMIATALVLAMSVGFAGSDGARDQKVTVAKAFADSFAANDLDHWFSLLADGFTAVYTPTGAAVLDKEQARDLNQAFIAAFPDMRMQVERVLVDGDFVALYLNATATHTGPLLLGGETISPTGQPVVGSLVYTAEIRDGKIVREWTHWDQWALLTQLGLMAIE